VVTASVIAEARRRAGLTQAELGRRLGIPQSKIARWERGHRTPSLERVREIVAACGLQLTIGVEAAESTARCT